jgi:DNA repair photolyase
MSNMYKHSRKQWNVIVGCWFECTYCEPSFKRQMKRQKNNCIKCYEYIPHFHSERLNAPLPTTPNGTFIWACSSCDIAFAKREWMEQILEVIRKKKDRTFLFQTKDPSVFEKYEFPSNVILCITLETNRTDVYDGISKAIIPEKRYLIFKANKHPRKRVTIEPILLFDHNILVEWIRNIGPELVYVGYDSKGCDLPEPRLSDTLKLIESLREITEVSTKLLKCD